MDNVKSLCVTSGTAYKPTLNKQINNEIVFTVSVADVDGKSVQWRNGVFVLFVIFFVLFSGGFGRVGSRQSRRRQRQRQCRRTSQQPEQPGNGNSDGNRRFWCGVSLLRYRATVGYRSGHRSNGLLVPVRAAPSSSERPGRRLRSCRGGGGCPPSCRLVSRDGRDGSSRRLQRCLPVIRPEPVPESGHGQHDGLLLVPGQCQKKQKKNF